ncbi:MAG: cyclic nucleotide-binding domain-containing protein [Rhizobiales bacterium]|nr:cyclic nucleotide-binding domain-containing protein [Hyphomicrobiales bacterium]
MPAVFDVSQSPFDRLEATEIEFLQDATDIEYYAPGATVLAAGQATEFLCIVLKGAVEERDGEELVSIFGPRDVFDSRSLVQGAATRSFVAREETLLYQIARDAVLKIVSKNDRFGAFFYLDISRKLSEMAHEEEEARFGSLMRSHVRDLFVHPAHFINSSDTIETAGHKMRDINSNALFVRDGERVGVITGMNLSKAVVLNRMSIDDPVRTVTHFDIVSLSPDDFVFSALLMMTKHNKRRVAVKDGDKFVGIVEDIDVLSFLAGNSQLVAGRIDRAAGIADLSAAANDIEAQVRRLRRQGVKADVIAEIVSDLNRRLFARTFEFTAHPDLRERSCLIVMGSEGRGEQTMRTDQDNGLILSEPVPEPMLNEFRESFTAALESFGFPPCPGNVMVRNPFWSRPLSEFVADFRSWVALPTPDAHMNVAIFYDADAVAGRSELLTEAKTALINTVRGERAYLAHFARAIDAFPTPIGFFRNLITSEGAGDALDLKKGGVFPIVHGVRSLALEHGLMETGTDQRILRLGETNVLKPEFARELSQAFRYFTSLRLDSQITQTPGASGTLTKPAELSSMDRELLRDAFGVVKQFRDIIRRHFNLAMF